MATNYEITYSDGNLTFLVSPYAANGPANPSSEAFYRGAIKADTSLVILGKGMDDYGERIQENMIHLLEHFSNEKEPVFPSGGQIWCDRSQSPPKLKVYNAKKHTNISSNQNDVVIEGDHTARFTGPNSLITIRLFSNIDYHKEDYKIIGVVFESVQERTKITISSPKGVRNGWYVGDWDDFIISSNGEIDAFGSTIINVADADITEGDQAVNVNTLKGYLQTGINLGDLGDVDIEDEEENEILYFNGTIWENAKISSVILAEGDLILGGSLNMDNHYITSIKQPKETDYYYAATVQYVNEKIPSGPGGTVSLLKHLNDVDDTLNPNTNHVLYYDGAKWTNLSKNDAPNTLGFVPLVGTSGGLVADNRPYYLNKDAVIHYNPSSEFLQNLTFEELRDAVTNDTLVSVKMGDTLWGEQTGTDTSTKVQFGEFDPIASLVNLGYEVDKSPEDPLIPGIKIPEDPDGVRFEFNVFETITKAPEPKTTEFKNLHYEKLLAKNIYEYPFISLEEIVADINGALGELSRTPYRVILDPATIPTLPSQTITNLYTVDRSNLEITIDGVKQYASIRNWVRSSIEPTNIPPTEIIGERIYAISEYDNTNSLIYTPGDITDRFSEVKDLQQTFTIIDNDNPSIPVGTYTIDFAELNKSKFATEIATVEAINLSGDDAFKYSIELDNVPNTHSKIWGGYPAGLNTGLIYSFKVTTDGADYYPIVTGSQIWGIDEEINIKEDTGKNVAHVIEEINLWSASHDSKFAAYAEGGFIYFVPVLAGASSDIQISNEIPSVFQFAVDAIYEKVELIEEGSPNIESVERAFVITGDNTSTFLSGLKFTVTGSASNDGIYTVYESEYKDYLNPGINKTYIFVQGAEIPSLVDNTGNVELAAESLFDSMTGDEFSDSSSYYYKFTDPTTWENKTDIETNIIMDGNYYEVGMTGFSSNTIVWNDDLASLYPTSKMEIIIT